ncbi:MAG: hypothetical protein HOH73_00845 [Alphaproteobacteria bacterium]|jgi:hypothetical protein|nr:hypothetical protein [Alphaproteobacteria bacterium]
MLFSNFKNIKIILLIMFLYSCSARNEFNKYNLSNYQVYNSIYENYTNIDHIAKLYGKPNYKRDDKIWFYNFNSFNHYSKNLEQNLIILEFDEYGKVIDKKIYYYSNYRSAYSN